MPPTREDKNRGYQTTRSGSPPRHKEGVGYRRQPSGGNTGYRKAATTSGFSRRPTENQRKGQTDSSRQVSLERIERILGVGVDVSLNSQGTPQIKRFSIDLATSPVSEKGGAQDNAQRQLQRSQWSIVLNQERAFWMPVRQAEYFMARFPSVANMVVDGDVLLVSMGLSAFAFVMQVSEFYQANKGDWFDKLNEDTHHAFNGMADVFRLYTKTTEQQNERALDIPYVRANSFFYKLPKSNTTITVPWVYVPTDNPRARLKFSHVSEMITATPLLDKLIGYIEMSYKDRESISQEQMDMLLFRAEKGVLASYFVDKKEGSDLLNEIGRNFVLFGWSSGYILNALRNSNIAGNSVVVNRNGNTIPSAYFLVKSNRYQ